MKQRRLTKKALAMSIACTLAFSLTPAYNGMAYAAEPGSEQSQETKETVKADAGAAQDDYALEAVTVEAKRPDWEAKLSPGTVTIIRPDDYRGEQKTLPELLKDVPGVHVREVNGKGQYTTVTVRGSTAAQVGVFVDGVLSNLGGDAAMDISTIPIHNVERIEVYRGYIPARFGGTYLGGVINVVTKKPDKANISASAGQSSWGGYTAGLELTQPLGTGSLMIGLNRDQSDGDFRYKDPGSDAAYAKWMPQYQADMTRFITETNQSLTGYGIDANFTTANELNTAFDNPVVYNQYLTTALDNYWQSYGWFSSKEEMLSEFGMTEQEYYDEVKTKLDSKRSDLNSATAAKTREMMQLSEDSTRWRRNNDYKNTDAMIKWQDDHWLVKGSWKKIDRGMPQGRYLTGEIDETSQSQTDLPTWAQRKRQELTTKDLLLGRRDTAGDLEWGWSVNYLKQDKNYRNEFYNSPWTDKDDYLWHQPLSVWSSYDSRRLGGAVDGSYKAGRNHLLEFMANWSKEKMDIDGWLMTDFKDNDIDNQRRFRNYYEQTLFNIQLQDTITLNDTADLWLTPSVRYNASTVLGRSSRLKQDQHSWFNKEDEQKDSKVTWQTALKKKVSDTLTLRSTVGTYYRLLNLYEIAGDGTSIMPRPVRENSQSDKLLSAFPHPEEGTQWDVSAIWDDQLLGADANIQLTYFGRKSENLLQLRRFGLDYACFTNTAKGRVNGLELQGNFSWDKWDMNLTGTYMKTKAWNKDDSPTGDNVYREISQTYTPDWEGSMRLTYRPDGRTAIFSEVKYVGEMYWSHDVPNHVQSSLTTIGLGAKYKVDKNIQVVAGVNDLFDKGPESRSHSYSTLGTGEIIHRSYLIGYPLQGRTYYATLQYRY